MMTTLPCPTCHGEVLYPDCAECEGLGYLEAGPWCRSQNRVKKAVHQVLLWLGLTYCDGCLLYLR